MYFFKKALMLITFSYFIFLGMQSEVSLKTDFRRDSLF